jgi:hypothetical protein
LRLVEGAGLHDGLLDASHRLVGIGREEVLGQSFERIVSAAAVFRQDTQRLIEIVVGQSPNRLFVLNVAACLTGLAGRLGIELGQFREGPSLEIAGAGLR